MKPISERELQRQEGRKMLKIENLAVNYGYITALRNISLQVNRGEIITLIGGNGAGKSTTLMSISNLVEKTNGKITLNNVDITNMPPDKIVKLGVCHVPEGRLIFPNLSVKENLITGTVGNPKLTKADIAGLLEEVYTLFPRLKERLSQMGGSLSGGEQQMLAIARGLMMDPDLIMLDEPSLGLAPIIIEEIFELILKINKKGKTILLIEQNAYMALQIAHRGYVLENGKIVIEGKGNELLVDERVRNAYLGE